MFTNVNTSPNLTENRIEDERKIELIDIAKGLLYPKEKCS